jgi:hypothetical protein
VLVLVLVASLYLVVLLHLVQLLLEQDLGQ